MPLNTVQTQLLSILDGIQIPGLNENLNAYISPPDPGDGTIPSAYIWGATAEDIRRSMPRTFGFRVIKHEVDIWTIWFGPADDPSSNTQFPAIIDAICQALRTAPMPVLNAKDPLTGLNSNIEMIAERLRWDYSPVHSSEDQRWLVYSARIICDVREQLKE